MRLVAVRGQATTEVEPCPAARDQVEQAGRRDGSDDLGDHVRDRVCRREAPTGDEATRDGRVQVASRHVAECVRHGEDGEAERQCDAEETDPHVREGSGEYGTSAASEHEPERPDELCACALRDRHVTPSYKPVLPPWKSAGWSAPEAATTGWS